jgi:hypothetical protein
VEVDDLLKGAGVEVDKANIDMCVGKIVVVGEDGKRIEKELGQGLDLNALIQEALQGGD